MWVRPCLIGVNVILARGLLWVSAQELSYFLFFYFPISYFLSSYYLLTAGNLLVYILEEA